MTLFDRVFNASIESPERPLTDATLSELFGGETVASGVSVSETSALRMPAVWRAVNLIAGTVASLPLHAYKTAEGAREILPPTTAPSRLLADPHDGDLTPFEFWEVVVTHLLLWGNAYLLMKGTSRYNVGTPDAFEIIHPSRVQVGRSADGEPWYRVQDLATGAWEIRLATELLHIPGIGYDGLKGMSPISAARQGIGLAMAAEEFGGRLFGSGSLATGILTTERPMNEDQALALQRRWREKRTGLKSSHETIVLDNGAKFQQLSIPPEDAQFLESRKFQVTEIARIFGIPPHMLADTEKSTSWGTGIEQQSIGFVVYTLRPWLARLESRLTKVLYPKPIYARFTVEGLLRGDSAQRAAFYQALWGMGALSTNEIRSLEDRGPVEGGDVRYRPLNHGELGTFDTADVPAPPDTAGGAA